ncbi:SCO family protein [Bombella pollinis]|uniref:SCO family protein n=1 Tax=Bombella pollinis TaxID=2967337 RepID=A0ABT3WLT2_9PROT|nr:SCO family protein [Bombella pollinis]MCX5619638.1 SCO family protein [Bombella pollinis]
MMDVQSDGTGGVEPKKYLGWKIGAVIAGLLLVAGLLGLGGYYLSTGHDEGARLHKQGNEVGGSFRVFSLGGGMVTEGDFRGAWMVVWFVDPRCPAAQCQPPLKALDATLMSMKAQGRKVLPLVVSLDAKAEDSDGLKDYVMGVAPHIFPVFATQNMTQAMTRLFHAPYEQERGTGYYKPAPSFVVMDPEGHYVGMLPVTHDSTALTAGLEHLMAHPQQKSQ